MNNNINKRVTTGTSNAETRQSTAGTIAQSVSMDMDLDLGSSLSSRQDGDDVLSNDALRYDDNTCSEDARITKELSDDALSMNDDTIMSDSEFDLEHDVQEVVFLGKEHQTKLLNEIKQLRIQLYKATSLSIKHIDNGTLASRASALRRQLKLVKENYDLLFDESTMKGTATGESSLVPSDTPFMQWKGHKFNTKKFIFQSIDACLTQFEDVLESRSISVEANWKRIIKPKMSTGMASWTRELIEKYPHISWGQFKSKLKAKYSPSEAEEKKAALNKLKNLKLEKCESLEIYIDKFTTLKDLAGVTENTSLTDYLLKGLDVDLYSPVSLNISQSRDKEKDTLDYAISQLRSVYDLLRRDSYYKEEKQRKEEELTQRIIKQLKQQGGHYGSLARGYNGNHNGNNGVAKQYHGFGKKPVRRAGKFHNKKRDNNGGETPKCFDCGFTPFTYAHKAVCKKNPKNLSQGKKKKSIVPTPPRNEDTTDSSDDESDQHFAVATIAPKKKGKEVSQMDTDSE